MTGSDSPIVEAVFFTLARLEVRNGGLLGWLTLTVNGLLTLDGVAVRISREGQLYLAYPTRRDRQGRDHACVKPADSTVAKAIEQQVFDLINLPGEVA